MSKIVTIYCEGKKGSHDFDILNKIIDNLHLLPTGSIIIDPVGSVRGAGSIINYKESNGIVKSDAYFLFRDRDFDFPIPITPMLEQDPVRKYTYYSYRNTIENYLFDTLLFYNFIQEKDFAKIYNIYSEEDVKAKFMEAADTLKYYQAARHAMGRMRTGETNFGTKWTEKSGALPQDLSEKSCRYYALDKILSAKKFTEEWTEDGFEKEFRFFLGQFDNSFMNNLDFLVYFQGKDFASYLTTYLMPQFPIKTYYTYAKKNFDYTKHPDLQQLNKLIMSYMQ